MIGDTIANTDHSSTTGDLPDWASHIVTLVKVNQDAYQSEYRYRGATADERVLIRNSLESPRKDGLQLSRHNFESLVTFRSDGSTYKTDVPYYFSMTCRFPTRVGNTAYAVAQMGAWTQWLYATSGVAGGRLLKMLNFES